MFSIAKENVKIVCTGITKFSGLFDSDNNALIEVNDPKLYFQFTDALCIF